LWLASLVKPKKTFNMLLDWLQEAQLDRVGCFTYSAVDGAVANELPDPVPEESQASSAMSALCKYSNRFRPPAYSVKLASTMTVLVDELDEEHPVAVARSYADAPEIDGNVFVEDIDRSQIKAGQLLTVEITDADEYDLFARLISINA
jgi:ribosomal protein S12 methylthiotransferase